MPLAGADVVSFPPGQVVFHQPLQNQETPPWRPLHAQRFEEVGCCQPSLGTRLHTSLFSSTKVLASQPAVSLYDVPLRGWGEVTHAKAVTARNKPEIFHPVDKHQFVPFRGADRTANSTKRRSLTWEESRAQIPDSRINASRQRQSARQTQQVCWLLPQLAFAELLSGGRSAACLKAGLSPLGARSPPHTGNTDTALGQGSVQQDGDAEICRSP